MQLIATTTTATATATATATTTDEVQIVQMVLVIFRGRMIPYGCLATGQSVGMIEVVRNAKTVMHILKQDIRSAMMVRTKELHSWIKEKNRSPSAVDKTTGSSEGYISISVYNNKSNNRSTFNCSLTGQFFRRYRRLASTTTQIKLSGICWKLDALSIARRMTSQH